jgi:hypothetical protein
MRIVSLIVALIVSGLAAVVIILEEFHYSSLLRDILPSSMASKITPQTNFLFLFASLIVLGLVWLENWYRKRKEKKESEPKPDHQPVHNVSSSHSEGGRVVQHFHYSQRVDSTFLHPPQPEPTPSAETDAASELNQNDPRIVIEFIDERRKQLYKKVALELINQGGSEALDVKIDDIPLRGQRVRFPDIAGVISGNGGRQRFQPVTDHRVGHVNSALFVNALMDEWNSHNDVNLKELPFPLRITYKNFSRTLQFVTTCNLIAYPYAEIVRRPAANWKPSFVLRDFHHSKGSNV